MTPNQLIEASIAFALLQHKGQEDKVGASYILHPLRVMLAVRDRGGTPVQQAAAVLHDVVEDCSVPVEEIEARFGIEVRSLVAALTKREEEQYEDFVRRALQVPGAGLIKKADIEDNYGRLADLEDLVLRERLAAKYEAALKLFAGSQA